jgi:hypothetical protein
MKVSFYIFSFSVLRNMPSIDDGVLFYLVDDLSSSKCLIAAKLSNNEDKFRKHIVAKKTDFRYNNK